MAEIRTKKVKAQELKVGDLFSIEGEQYWTKALKGYDGQVGEKVYVRTEAPCPQEQKNQEVYKIEITPVQDVEKEELEKILNDCCREAQASNSCFSDWEQDFIESINDQYSERGFLTDRQIEILERTWNKI